MAPSQDTRDALAQTAPSSGEPAPPAPEGEDLTGRALGDRYQVKRLLGRGGMGSVYLATDLALGTDVALKVVSPRYAGSQGAIDRIRAEVLLAQRVTHPNVCRTYDLEQVGPMQLVKMEYVAGPTLAHRLAALPRLSVPEVLEIGRQIALGLAAAHARDVVHCDLKPPNVLIEETTGRIVLMDFGIAHAAAGGGAGAALAGTPCYMAPEQWRNQKLDGRTDLYALGCLLFEALAGQLPFSASTPNGWSNAHRLEAPPLLRQLRPEVPPWAAALVARLLAKDPAQRPASAEEVARALLGPRRAPASLRAGVAAAVIAACAGGVLAFQLGSRSVWQPQLRQRLPTYVENGNALGVSPDGRWLAYDSDRDGSWRIYLEPLGGGEARALTGPGLSPRFGTWAHDGQAILLRTVAQGVYRVTLDGQTTPLRADASSVVDCAGTLVFQLPASPGCPTCPRRVVTGEPERELARGTQGVQLALQACDRDGKRVAYLRIGATAQLWVAQLDGASARLVADKMFRVVVSSFPHLQSPSTAFAPDGRSLLYLTTSAQNAGTWEIPLTGGEPRPLLMGQPAYSMSPTPDGAQLLFNNDITTTNIQAFDLDARTHTRLSPSSELLHRLTVSADGSTLLTLRVAGEGDGEILAVRASDGARSSLGPANEASLSPDGREVVFSQLEPDGGTALGAMTLDGRARRTLARIPERVLRIAAGGDGAMHLTTSGGASSGAWRLGLDGSPPLPEAPAPATLLVPSPRGDFSLALHSAPRAQLLLLPRGATLEQPSATVEARVFAWAADGASFFYWNGSEVRRRGVDSGEDDKLFDARFFMNSLAPSPDGKTLYYLETTGRVQRMVVANFGDRK